jgi:hypothetical protein
MALNTSIGDALTEQKNIPIMEKSTENPAQHSIKELTIEQSFNEQQYKEIGYTSLILKL